MLRSAILLTVVSVTFLAAPAMAGRCRIKNETKHSFTVESGNVSNQRIGAHTSTTIASGTIIGKASGATVSGSCRDGDNLKIVEERGVPILVPLSYRPRR